ncbi:MAG: flagellar export protein FliJ [Ectothiorhodospiraceae bacterium]|nr:flagellar export protein FliJ [Ectothiorhodospiraceae bacterium]MCH8504012.1 flagellar export protein FliJ [Ectothiorhodospiraceae bacterium]
MTRIKRMETVQGVLGNKADRAAREMARVGEQVQHERERLQQLEDFRNDYLNGAVNQEGVAMDAFRLRDFNAFIAKLDTAIGQQRKHLRELEQQLTACREQWQEEQRRADAVGKVVDGYRTEERRKDDQAEQRRSDELAMQRFFRK